MNITESQYNGFWFTLKEEELTLGLIGDQLIEPVIIWNDTLREGPRDIKYFGLTNPNFLTLQLYAQALEPKACRV